MWDFLGSGSSLTFWNGVLSALRAQSLGPTWHVTVSRQGLPCRSSNLWAVGAGAGTPAAEGSPRGTAT